MYTTLVLIVEERQNLKSAFEKITEPLLLAVRHDLTAIASRLHRVDFGKAFDPDAGVGGPSLYMRDMVDKLTFVRDEVLGRFNVGELSKTWCASLPSPRYRLLTKVPIGMPPLCAESSAALF